MDKECFFNSDSIPYTTLGKNKLVKLGTITPIVVDFLWVSSLACMLGI